MKNLAEYLFEHRAKNLPAIDLAEIFDRLIWVLDDNDRQIMETIETWLLGNDSEKIEIALLMNEIFPFEDRLQMENVLNRIAIDFPKLSHHCSKLIDTRRKQHSA